MAVLVGLTGGTGSGKSTLARALAGCGAVVIDADALARDVVAVGTPGLAAIAAEFGADVLDQGGALRREHLAGVVFADPARLRALEAITHPLIEQRRAELMAGAATDAVVVHDMPLIVELGTAASYHLVLVVDAPQDVRVRRLVGRGMAADDARRRIAAQATTAQRRAVADVWFHNTGLASDLADAGQHLWDSRLRVFADNLRAGRPAVRSSGSDSAGSDASATGVMREQVIGAGERAAARLRHVLPAADVQIAQAHAPAGTAASAGTAGPRWHARLTLPSAADSDADHESLTSALARAGFFPDGTGGFASADPGLNVDILPPSMPGS